MHIAERCLLLALLLVGGCSENPLNPDEAVDPEAYLFGEQPSGASCDDVCDKLQQCFDYDRGTCEDECQQLTPDQREAIVQATCEQIAAEIF